MMEYENLYIEERSMINDVLYADVCIWINKHMPSSKKCAILAEEIGHHETTSGDILDQSDMNSRKQELTARKWAYEKTLSKSDIEIAFKNGCREIGCVEYLDIDETFLRDALIYYRILDI